MTTAILAADEAPRAAGARVTLSLPSVRALALSASLVCHGGLALFAYTHASAPVHAELQANRPAIEISIANVEPDVLVEPTPSEAHDVARAASTPRNVAVASAPVATAPALNATQPSAVATAAPEQQAVPLDSAQPAAPRFIMQAPAVVAAIPAVAGANVGSTTSASDTENAGSVAAPYAENQVDSPAKLQAGAPPAYTSAAEAAGVEAQLPMELVIDRSGAVQSARTLEHVGYGLDEAAVAAVKRYRFSPARRAGNAVAVRMRWSVRFQLR